MSKSVKSPSTNNKSNDTFEVRDIRSQPWLWVDKIILSDYVEEIGAIGFLIYCALVSYANSENKCWPSYQTLAIKLKLGRSTVIKSIKNLVDVGLIGVEKRQTEIDGHISNIYVLLSVKPRLTSLTKEEKDVEPSPLKTPGLVQEKDQPSPSQETTLVHQKHQASIPERPYLYLHDQDLHEGEKEKQIDTSHSLSVSFAHPLNSPCLLEEKEKPKTETPVTKNNHSDNRSKHPAIKAVYEIIGRYPQKLVWDEIIQVVGEQPDIPRLKQCAKEWAKRSSNMFNISVWLFDWYKNGLPINMQEHLIESTKAKAPTSLSNFPFVINQPNQQEQEKLINNKAIQTQRMLDKQFMIIREQMKGQTYENT